MRSTILRVGVLSVLAALIAAPSLARAENITIPKDTDVILAFDDSISSKTAKEGDRVRMHVASDVIVAGTTVIKAGTPATAIVSKVEKRKPFGINAKLKLAIEPVKAIGGHLVPLEP